MQMAPGSHSISLAYINCVNKLTLHYTHDHRPLFLIFHNFIMSLNDKDVTLGGNKGVDLHPGVANPTASSTHADPLAANFVRPPWLQALVPGICSQLPLPGA